MANDPVNEIRDRLDIVDLVSENVDLKRAGRNFKGLCPFHQEKTASFVVFPDSQNFHCFGCGKGGDVFTYYMDTQGLGFRESLTDLARRAGIELDDLPTVSAEVRQTQQTILELLDIAADYFSGVLLRSEAGQTARDYLSQRGVSAEIVDQFGLGLAPDGWDYLLRQLDARGVDHETAVAAGLIQINDEGRTYDRFRNRLMFPIHDRDGQVVGFGGRALADDTQPKYLNSPQSVVFDKSSLLYGLHFSRDAIRQQDQTIIVEGYMDVLAAHQFGYRNVVAAMGTALTEHQVDLVKRLTRRVVLALDADAAGQMATERAFDTFDAALDHEEEFVAAAEGAIRVARRLDAEIRIIELPEGEDPDSIIRADADIWSALTKNATPFVEFLIRKTVESFDITSASEKRHAIDRLAPVIQRLPDAIDRSHYVERLSRILGLPYTEVQSRVRQTSSRRASGRQLHDPAPVSSPGNGAERHLMSIMLRYSEVGFEFLDAIVTNDFDDPRNRAILEFMRETCNAGSRWEEARSDLDREYVDHADRLEASLKFPASPLPDKIRNEITQTLEKLRRNRFDSYSQYLRDEIAQTDFESDIETVAALVQQLNAIPDAHQRLYPRRSTYFRDSRNTAEEALQRSVSRTERTDSPTSSSSSGNTDRRSSNN